jgi:putative SOS response-associated peptidase YedK
MCGRYASARSVDDIAAAFGIRDDRIDVVAAADWNVAPTKDVAAVLDSGDGRRLTSLRWGLVPSWADDPSIGARLINARLETIADKPAFRSALASRRCLLPADGWYEWATRPDGVRQAYYLTPPDGEFLAFAGLWETWYDADGRPLRTATIVTGAAPDDLRAVHDRAPIVLPPAAWTAWLDRHSTPRQLDAVLCPTPAGLVTPRPVGPEVGDVRANGPHLLDEVAVVEQPTLF